MVWSGVFLLVVLEDCWRIAGGLEKLYFVDRRMNEDCVLVVCGVGMGRRWKCRVANLFGSVLVPLVGGISVRPIV